MAQTIAADLTTPDQRARSFGMIGAAFGIGFIIGPAFGGTKIKMEKKKKKTK